MIEFEENVDYNKLASFYRFLSKPEHIAIINYIISKKNQFVAEDLIDVYIEASNKYKNTNYDIKNRDDRTNVRDSKINNGSKGILHQLKQLCIICEVSKDTKTKEYSVNRGISDFAEHTNIMIRNYGIFFNKTED